MFAGSFNANNFLFKKIIMVQDKLYSVNMYFNKALRVSSLLLLVFMYGDSFLSVPVYFVFQKTAQYF